MWFVYISTGALIMQENIAIIRINNVQPKIRQYLPHYQTGKDFQGTVVNWTLSCA